MPERFSPAQPNYLRFVSTPTIDIEPKKYAGIVYKRRITAAVQDAVGLLAQDLPVRAAGQIGAEIAQFQARSRPLPREIL